MLIRGLPPESATRARIDNGPDSGPAFTLMNYQLADLFDAVSEGNWLTANKDVPQNKRGPKPRKYPRPDTIREANRRAVSRKKKLADLRQRAARRRELIASGQIG